MSIIDEYGDLSKLQDTISLSRKIWDIKFLKDEEKYHDLIKEYRKFIKMAAELLRNLSVTEDSIRLATMISYLLALGDFSYGDKFIILNKNKDVVTSVSGINVVTGSGCCRHCARFTTDLMLELGMFSENFYCVLSEEKADNKIHSLANHVANLIVYDSNLYVYDILNKLLFHFSDTINLSDFDEQYYLTYAPRLLLAREKRSLEELEHRLYRYKLESKKEHITKDEYDDIRLEVFTKLVLNEGIVEDFKHDSKQIKTSIVDMAKAL